MNTLNLTNDINKDIQNIKAKLEENNIIQIEIKPNHLFVNFKKMTLIYIYYKDS